VALLVLAIGLLGLASLQAQSLKFNHDAYVRSQATTLAYQLMDSMRANRGTDYAVLGDPDLACDPTVATPAMDLSCWFDALPALLPSGRGAVAQNAVTPTMFDVTLQWADREIVDEDDCNAAPGRAWDGTDNVCLVTQTWTILP